MADVLNRLKQGERAALKELLDATCTPLYRYLYRFLGDEDAAVAVLTDAYGELLGELEGLKEEKELRASLWQRAHRLAAKKAFSAGAGPKAPRAGVSRKSGPPAFVSGSRDEAVRRLAGAWAELDVPYREALAIAGIDAEVAYDAAAERIEASAATVKSRLAYALRALLKSF